jgi:hypothetical protein
MPRNQPRKPRLKRVSVRPVKHEQPDWDRFAWALLQHTKSLSKPKLAPKRRKGTGAP